MIYADDTSGLLMTRFKRLKQPELKIAIDKKLKQRVWKSHQGIQITRQFCVFIAVARFPADTP
jgi:hypothetical protein